MGIAITVVLIMSIFFGTVYLSGIKDKKNEQKRRENDKKILEERVESSRKQRELLELENKIWIEEELKEPKYKLMAIEINENVTHQTGYFEPTADIQQYSYGMFCDRTTSLQYAESKLHTFKQDNFFQANNITVPMSNILRIILLKEDK